MQRAHLEHRKFKVLPNYSAAWVVEYFRVKTLPCDLHSNTPQAAQILLWALWLAEH